MPSSTIRRYYHALWFSATLVLIITPFAMVGPVFHFTDAFAFSFGAIANISGTAGTSAVESQIAVLDDNVYIVWSDSVSGNNEIFVSRSVDNGITFSTPIDISNSGDSSTIPQIAVSGNNVYVVWQEAGDTSREIFFAESINSGEFTTPTNISNSPDLPSSNPKIAVFGSEVYVAWEEPPSILASLDIFLAASSNDFDPVNISDSDGLDSSGVDLFADNDGYAYAAWVESNSTASTKDIFFSSNADSGGDSFDTPVNISNGNKGLAKSPQVFASNSDAYVVWGDIRLKDLFFATSTDGFSNIANVSKTGKATGAQLDMFASGDSIYIAWKDRDFGNDEILFSYSLDAGATFSDPPYRISNSPQTSINPRISADESNIYIAWQEDELDEVSLAAASIDDIEFIDPIQMSSGVVLSATNVPELAASANNAYLIWQENISGSSDVFFRTLADSGPPSITIEANSTSARWGLDPIGVSGIVNGNATDTIVVDWDDGTTSDPIAVSGNSWGPITHNYTSSNTGPKEITATLLDELDAEKALDTVGIEVEKHSTSLTLDSIPSMIIGDDVTASGVLTDVDASIPVGSKTITFSGTGASNLLPDITLVDGSYSSSGSSPNTEGDLRTVQASFAGDTGFMESQSEIVTYDTVPSDAAQFGVSTGSSSVELTGFDALISFDDVQDAGTIFVFECDTPASPRYEELDKCLEISSAATLAEDSAAHVSISVDESEIPSGHSADEVDIFHEELAGIVDITESRESSDGSITVTGKTTGFSKFIVGMALHDELPAGAARQQVFVGDNELEFDFTGDEKEIELDGNNYQIGDSVEIFVSNPARNLDDESIDSVNATANSTSDADGIIVELLETGADTGNFTGSFLLTSGSSSDDNDRLHVQVGDEVRAFYNATGRAPLKLTIDGISEAGMVQVISYDAPDRFAPVGDGYKVSLVDAQFGLDANVTVTLSYANVPDADDLDINEFRVLKMDGGTCVDEITLIDSIGEVIGLDTDENTIAGNTTSLGQFTIGFPGLPAPRAPCESGDPGTAGGGVAHPGAGIVLDAIASIVKNPSHHGGGGHSSLSQPPIQEALTGQDISVLTVDGQKISISFESVEAGEKLDVKSKQASDFKEIFDQISGDHGIVHMEGSTYATTGELFDIDASDTGYKGQIETAISYNESLVQGQESDIRMLHYNEDDEEWEDVTIAIDTENNIVTGLMDSLSPVAIALVDDGTFGKTYFEANPTSRIAILGSSIARASADEQISMPTIIKNIQRTNQTYAVIVQVIDQDGIARNISWQTGTLAVGQSTEISNGWNAEAGIYTIQIFVWDNIDNPSALSSVTTRTVQI